MRLQRKSPLRIALAEFHAFLYEFPVPVAVSGVAWLYEAMGGLYRGISGQVLSGIDDLQLVALGDCRFGFGQPELFWRICNPVDAFRKRVCPVRLDCDESSVPVQGFDQFPVYEKRRLPACEHYMR